MDNVEELQVTNRIGKKEYKVSVRNLVEFILRQGDLDSSHGSGIDPEAMQAGSRLHRKIQSRGGSYYTAEVPLSIVMELDHAVLTVEGRADGIIKEPEKIVVIDEIKTMYKDVFTYEEPEPLHVAQARCYAYIYARQKEQEQMGIRLTYCNLETEQKRYFDYTETYVEMEKWFFQVISEYEKFLDYEIIHGKAMVDSAKPLQFPFEYRKGQESLTKVIYSTMKREELLFVQAPTGVGKTMSSVFPAVKALGEGLATKLFYLTAKTITRTVAEESFSLLREKGLIFQTVTLTAKEKLCVLEEMNCSPITCPRAKGHYDRVNDCLYDMITNELVISREVLLEYSEKYQVCPFELCLDAAFWADGVICDYNYVFDPNVYLKRFFADSNSGKADRKYVFLIDEAHNLVDRARSMYSAHIFKEDILTMKKIMAPISKKVAKECNKVNEILLAYRKMTVDYAVLDECERFVIQLMRLSAALEETLNDEGEFEGRKEVLDIYFDIRHFLNMYEVVDEGYRIYVEQVSSSKFMIRLFCINPSNNLSKILEKGISSIFFSATLLPVNYYKELLSGDVNSKAVYIDSPFAKENRYVAIGKGVTTKYNMRGIQQYERMVEYIRQIVSKKKGNYMVFFSSYKLMQDVYDVAVTRGLDHHGRLIIQENDMNEAAREQFIQEFYEENDKSLIAFCILGGIFSEGIDLTGEKLIGAIIVGNGLPQIGTEQNLLMDYYKEAGKDAFAYAYTYPGMNKVQQAAGRVIRTQQDQGTIVLLEERFSQYEYQSLFPREWSDIHMVDEKQLSMELDRFWSGH